MGFVIDGNWIDLGSLATGIIYVAVKFFAKLRRAKVCRLVSRQTGVDFANGAALFPLMVLSLSAISSEFVKSLMEASRMSLTIAGVSAFIAIVYDAEEQPIKIEKIHP